MADKTGGVIQSAEASYRSHSNRARKQQCQNAADLQTTAFVLQHTTHLTRTHSQHTTRRPLFTPIQSAVPWSWLVRSLHHPLRSWIADRTTTHHRLQSTLRFGQAAWCILHLQPTFHPPLHSLPSCRPVHPLARPKPPPHPPPPPPPPPPPNPPTSPPTQPPPPPTLPTLSDNTNNKKSPKNNSRTTSHPRPTHPPHTPLASPPPPTSPPHSRTTLGRHYWWSVRSYTTHWYDTAYTQS